MAMKCTKCDTQMEQSDITTSLTEFRGETKIDLQIICEICGAEHYTFLGIDDLTVM